MTPGYTALEVQDGQGERVALRPFAHTYEFTGQAAAVGALRGDPLWDVGLVTDRGVFHCIDLASCQDRWQLDLGLSAHGPIPCVAVDVDGDSCDEFLAGLPDGRLVALTETDGSGAILWAVQRLSAWDDGTVQILVSPLELLEKLAALVPPPRLHLIRYHGVLAPHARDRASTAGR